MNSKCKLMIKSDLYRYYGDKRVSLFRYIFLPIELKYIIILRKTQYDNSCLKLYYKVKLFFLQRKTSIQIPSKVNIGKGFYIGHHGTIIINPLVRIGDNVNIATGVTIGQANRGEHKGVPTIGNKVWIGTNSVIVGKITIGDNVLIAPNSYVNCDIPSNSIVIGNPAVVRYSEKATEYYINKIVL